MIYAKTASGLAATLTLAASDRDTRSQSSVSGGCGITGLGLDTRLDLAL